MITRRKFLTWAVRGAGGVALMGVGVASYARFIEPHWLRVIERDLPLAGLPAKWEGLRLVQLSDLHVGSRVDDDYLAAVMQRVQRLAPDLVALTGDLINGEPHNPKLDRLSQHLTLLGQPPHGIVACLGNHDYGVGWRNEELAQAVTDRAQAAGVRVLRNASLNLGGLHVMGVEDYWGPNYQPPRFTDPPTIALCHNPDAVDEPSWATFQGWVLAGHTHGGQVRPPFLPPPMLPVRNKRYTCGVFDLAPGRSLHISSGVGYLRKVRLNVRPSVTVFTLRNLT